MVERRSSRTSRFESDDVVFYDNDRCGLPTTHNRPLYITASMNVVELERFMLDFGSSINIISLSTLDMVGNSRDKIITQLTEVSSFRGNKTFTIDFVCPPVPMIDSQTNYHLLLDRP